jgi:undecaprenyl-diphosphatase
MTIAEGVSHRASTQEGSAPVLHHHGDVVSPSPLALRLGQRWAGHPLRAAALVGIAGYLGLTLLLFAIGFVVMGSPGIERWDDAVMRRIAAARSTPLEAMAQVASYMGETLVVIAIAAVSIGVMAWRRIWDGVGLLMVGLLVEVTVFLTVSTTIARERPEIDPLDPAPPTGSYPSGHTAAAVVLYCTLAAILATRTSVRAVRILCWIVAIGLASAVGFARLVLGMHHPTDIVGSLVGALSCMLIALLATRTAVVAARTEEPPRAKVRDEMPREAVRP